MTEDTMSGQPAPPVSGVDIRTFLIADVRGYTRFTRQHGSEKAARLAQRFAELVGDAVASRAGRVVELRGDEALAVFSSERQAVRAAIELQATLSEETRADPDLPLPVGIGIDAGEVVPVGDGFRGSALNLAARLCAQAQAGEVLVSAAVQERTGSLEAGAFQSRGRVALKGFEDAVEVFEVISSLEPSPPPHLDQPPEVPLELVVDSPQVGRDLELSWLRGAWRGARRGRGRIVLVSGPAGIGKTSLAAALAADVVTAGGTVAYAGAGGAALARVGEALNAAAAAAAPALLVLDDVDLVGAAVADALADRWDELHRAPVLVVCLARDPDRDPALAAQVRRADVEGDGHHVLPPLELSGVIELARVYAGGDAGDIPVEAMLRSSNGVPGRLHELLDTWAREEAARRLEAAAQWLSAGRDRRSADLAFAHNAIERRLQRRYVDAPEPETVLAGPYRGLTTYGRDDADWFFGRERLVGDLAARTVGCGLLAVVGPSGAGKSSLVLAGLLPSLAADLLPGSRRWNVVSFRPGAMPTQVWPEQAVAAATPTERLVVAIDQFEEAFTACEDDGERAAFFDLVVAAAADPDRVVVVLTLRGDFLDHVASHAGLAELVAANQVLVCPMSADEYRRVIEQPARRCGTRVESALTEALVADASGQPGALPLLSTALVELWRTRDDGWLRLSSYEAGGGLERAVARLAEESYQSLDDAERRAAHRIFLRLAGSSETEGVTRRRVAVSEFDADRDPAADAVLRRFVRDRLLTRDGDALEVAHEALLREWPRVRDWLAADEQGRALRQHLIESARIWEDQGRRSGDLYRAERLSAALEWRGEHADVLNQLERDFLAASQRAGTRELRRLRVGAAVLAVLLLAAVIAGIVALSQRRTAQREAASARAQARVAIAQRVGQQSLTEADLSRSLLMAVQSVELDPSAGTESDLLGALVRARSAVTVYHARTRLLAAAVSPDGRTLAVGNNDGRVILFDAATGRQEGPLIPARDGINPVDVAFSPDGRTLAMYADAHGHGRVFLVDVRTRRVVGDFKDPSPHTIFTAAAFAPNGRSLALIAVHQVGLGAASQSRLFDLSLPGMRPYRARVPVSADVAGVWYPTPTTIITSAATGTTAWRAPGLLPLHRSPLGAGVAAISPGGGTLALASPHGRPPAVTLLNLRNWSSRAVSGGGFEAMTWPAGGGALVGLAPGGRVTDLDLADGATQTIGREPSLRGLAAAPDGQSVYTTSLDKTAVRWGLRGGTFSSTFRVAPPGAGSVYVAADRGPLAIASTGATTVRVWNLATRRPIGPPLSPGPKGGWGAISPDGTEAAGASLADGRVTLWNTRTGAVNRHLNPPEHIESDWLTFSPDGRLVVSATQLKVAPLTYKHGHTLIWDARTGRLLADLHQPGDNGVSYAAFSPDEHRIVTVGEAGSVAVWDVAHHRLLRSWRTSDAYTNSGVFTPDGRIIATGGVGGGLVELWNARTGARLQPISSSGKVSPIGFFDRGRRLIVEQGGAAALRIQVWDVPDRRLMGELAVPGSALAAVSPDDRRVVASSVTGLLSAWPLSTAVWLQDACRIANRNLSRAEWDTFLSGLPYTPACLSRT